MSSTSFIPALVISSTFLVVTPAVEVSLRGVKLTIPPPATLDGEERRQEAASTLSPALTLIGMFGCSRGHWHLTFEFHFVMVGTFVGECWEMPGRGEGCTLKRTWEHMELAKGDTQAWPRADLTGELLKEVALLSAEPQDFLEVYLRGGDPTQWSGAAELSSQYPSCAKLLNTWFSIVQGDVWHDSCAWFTLSWDFASILSSTYP